MHHRYDKHGEGNAGAERVILLSVNSLWCKEDNDVVDLDDGDDDCSSCSQLCFIAFVP